MRNITKKIRDPEIPLPNENHEKFCQEYVRLDLDEGIANLRMRRGLAYRNSFEGNELTKSSRINDRAISLLTNPDISERIEHLYSIEGSSVGNKFNWTRTKAEEILRMIATDSDAKAGERIKAVETLNKMRGLDKPEDVNEVVDEVSSFLDKLMGR